ncbi:hypothetical protein B0H19DRAFT_721653 [Mycena capillaripes]|nr:hypothetical protein B0H19DRAFT_721653 [Mycena capillaripes]
MQAAIPPEEFQDDRSLKPILTDVWSFIYSTVTIFANGHRLAFSSILLHRQVACILFVFYVSVFFMVIVTPTSSSAIFFLLALMTPLTVGIKPALYALIAVYLEFLGGAPRRDALFGVISVVEMVGKTLSYIMYVPTYDSLWRTSVKVGFMLTAALLAAVANRDVPLAWRRAGTDTTR